MLANTCFILMLALDQQNVFADQVLEINAIIATNKEYLDRLEPDLKTFETLQERAKKGVVNGRAEKPIVIQPKGFPVLYKTEEIKKKDIDARQEKIDRLKKNKNTVLSGNYYFAPELFKYEKTRIGGLGIPRNNKVILVKELEKGLGESTFRALAQVDYLNKNGRESVMLVVFQGYFKFNKPGQTIQCKEIMEFLGNTDVEITKTNQKDGKESVENVQIPEIAPALTAQEKIAEALTGVKIPKEKKQAGEADPNAPIVYPEKKEDDKKP